VQIDTRTRRSALIVLLTTVAIHQLGTGLLFTLIPLRLALDGVAAKVIGGISTVWSIGFLVGCLGAPYLIGALGARTAVAVGAILNAIAALMLFFTDNLLAWTLARGMSGVATATAFTTVESWLGAQSTAETRSTVFGVYMTINRVVFAAGQLLLTWVDPRVSALFLLAAVAYLLAPVPALLVKTEPPPAARPGPTSLLALPLLAPAAAAAALVHGLITTAAPSLFPVYGIATGLTPDRIAVALALIQIGGLIAQLPMARLSDVFGRRVAMMYVGGIGLLVSAATAIQGTGNYGLLLLMVTVWGGMPSVLYALAAAHANDLAPDGERTTWAASLMLLWGIGSMLGPITASALMDWLGSSALFLFTGVLSGVFTTFILLRRRIRPPTGERRPLADASTRSPGPAAAPVRE
jgi:MFS family permease